MKSYDLALVEGAYRTLTEMVEMEEGDYLLKRQVQTMCQSIKCALNYHDYDQRITEILEQEGL